MLRYVINDREPSGKAAPDKVAEHDSAEWVNIPGYLYQYRISDWGVVQRYWPTKNEWRTMSQYMCGGGKNPRYRACVKLTLSKGHAKNVFVVDLMADAFLGGRDNHPGKVIMHKNGNKSDCSKYNLQWATQVEIGKRYGGNGRRSIEKLDRDGNVVDLFRSTTECCAHEYISRKTLWRILKGKTLDIYRPTGYTYRYEEDYDG